MRRTTIGIMIAAIVLSTTFVVSYAILNHFYGAGQTITSTKGILIDNIWTQNPRAYVENVEYNVGGVEFSANENAYQMNLSPLPEGDIQGSIDISVPSGAYKKALENQTPLTISDTTTTKTEPINALPIATAISIAMGLMFLAVWTGYQRIWGDATTTLLEQGLHDMTVRDVEIVGEMIEMKEFTIPELMGRTHASKLKVWRTVQKLAQRGIVQSTGKTKPAASGLGGRGKPSRVYQYVGKQKTE